MTKDERKNIMLQIRQQASEKLDADIAVGIDAIQNKDCTALDGVICGMKVVICNKTGLRGIVAEGEVEIVPCIFECVNIHPDGYAEVRFKGLNCRVLFVDRLDDKVFHYGDSGAYVIRTPSECRKSPLANQLYGLLSKRH